MKAEFASGLTFTVCFSLFVTEIVQHCELRAMMPQSRFVICAGCGQFILAKISKVNGLSAHSNLGAVAAVTLVQVHTPELACWFVSHCILQTKKKVQTGTT
jgi:hypothetical protein